MSKLDKKYDVVILTHAPKSYFAESLLLILNQTISPEKIIVYNTNKELFDVEISNSLGLTIDDIINKRFKEKIEVIHIDENEFDHGKARNDATKLGNAEYILFLTDDAVPYDNLMCEKLLSAFDKYSTEKSKVAVTYARQIARNDAKLKERYIREFNYPDYDIIKEKSKEAELGIKNYFCSNVCAMYDRDIFNKMGCFEENLILNEDTFYVYKAINSGYKVVYCAEAKVEHSHNLNYREQFSRNFDIGVSQQEKRDIFEKIPSISEGKRLALYVTKKLLSGLHIFMIVDFWIECIYRYLGFCKGKNYEKLSIDKCIKYASNKKYFIKKKA